MAAARREVARTLQGLRIESLELILVLTSELVTNAVRHGAGPVGVHLTWEDRGVRIEVEDRSPKWPLLQAVDVDAVSGRGLLLVEALAGGWGVERTENGKSVWFTYRP